MHLKRTQYTRLKSQWRFLSKQLRRLSETGKFQQLASAKKHFLQRRLKQLFQQMLRFERAGQLKKALGIAVFLLGVQTSQAQVTFAPIVENPFGLVHSENLSWNTLVDIDNDGDLDIISVQTDYAAGDDSDQTLDFRENMSTNDGTVPVFAEPVQSYQGIVLPDLANFGYNNPEFGDLDNDGDLDLLIGAYEENVDGYIGTVLYYENIGDSNNPAFGEPQTNPFNFDLVGSTTSSPHLVDLDDDGDLDYVDLLSVDDYSTDPSILYFENIGTADAPNFAAAQTAPFGLPTNSPDLALIDFGDLDNDGDIDIISGGIYDFFGYSPAAITFVENIGTADAPSFAAPVT
ncbi:MAG: hypothetical protein AAGJ93_00940, partial [Bacteroidota bacterium]